MTEQRKLQIPVEVDATGAKQGFGEVKSAAQDMAQAVQAAGVQASRGVDGIGAGAPATTQKVDAATRSIIGSIQRTTAVMEAGGRTSAKYFETLAEQRGVSVDALKPYLAQLEAVNAKQAQANGAMNASAAGLTKVGDSAKQTAFALRQVPAQITDIVTSLASGQAPLTVLIQQGGQLKDLFGGVVPAAKALGGAVLGMVNPLTVAGAAIGGIALAALTGSKELRGFQNAATLTGGAIGVTSSKFAELRESISSIATQGKAAETLTAIAAAGFSAGANVRAIAEAAILMEKATGQAIDKTIDQFKDLAKAPGDAAARLNEQYNFLTAAIYLQIKALEEQGRKQEAVDLAERTYADALKSRAQTIQQNLGIVERSWSAVAGGAKAAWDAMLGIGRGQTVGERLAAVQKEIARASGPFDPSAFGGNAEARAKLAANKELEASLQEMLRLEKRGAEAAAERADITRKTVDWEKDGEQFLTKRQQRERDLTRAQLEGQALVNAGVITEAELRTRLAGIRDKYKEVDAASINQYNDLIQRIRERIRVADEEIRVGRQLTDTEREEAKILELLAGAKGKVNDEQKKAIAGALEDAKAKELLLQIQRSELKAAEETAARRQSLRGTDYEQSAAGIKEIEAASRAAVRSADDQVRALRDEAEAAQIAAAQNVTLAEAVQMVTIARLRDRQAKLSADSPLQTDLENELRLRNEGLQRIAAKAEADRIKDIFASIDTTAQRVWTDVAHGGENAFKRIGDTLKASVLDLLYQMTIKKWIVNIGAQISASVLGGATSSLATGAVQGGISAALGGGGGLLGGVFNPILSSMGSFGGGLSAGLGGLGGLFGANAAGTTFAGALDAGFTALGAGNIAGGLGTLAGTLGPIALVAAPIIGSLLKKGGAPKQGGYAGLVGSMGGDNSLGAGIRPVVESYQQQLDSLIRGLGGSASLQLGLGVLTDPKGTAPSFVSGAVGRDGQIIAGSTNYNVGRDEASLQAAIQAQMKESLLTALKASDIQGALGDYIKSISDTSQIDAAIARVQKAIAEKQSLEDQLFDLTATDAQKLARSRDQQRAVVDATNRALLEQVFQQQDLKRAADEAKAAFADLSRTLDSALSSYRTNAVSGIGRGEAFAQIQAALTISQAGGPAPDLAKLKDAISVLSAPSEQAASSLREYVRQRDAEAALLEKLKTQYDVGGAAPAVSAAQAAANQAATTAATTAALQAVEKQLQDANDKLAAMARDAKTTAQVLDGAATGALYLQTDYTGAGA